MSFLDCSCISQTEIEPINAGGQVDGKNHPQLKNGYSTSQSSLRDEMTIYATNASHYQLLCELGKSFSNLTTVNLAKHIPSGNMVVVKRTNMDTCSEENLSSLQNELLIWQFLRHPNILPHPAVFAEGSELWVILAFTAYGSASSLLKLYFTEGMSESLMAHIFYGVLKALDYIHQMGCIHRSVKPSNILITEEGHIYLSGLHGLCSMISDGQRLRVVYDFPVCSASILPWLSPEVLQQDLHGYDAKSDIYSLGITACELARGQVPFQNTQPTQMLLQKLKGSLCLLDFSFPQKEQVIKNSRSGMDSGIGESVATYSMIRTNTSERSPSSTNKTFSAAFHSFVELCLQREPGNRPSARMLLSHPFFKQVKKQTKSSLINLLQPAVPLSGSQATLGTSVLKRDSPITTLQDLDGDWEF
ncbi:STE20-related kinase adapter protein beta isoform X1 [Amblyraja radiata]|uniref:STE20-related kinase adapter protein beta n=1 Tax=Leucoraja erinaceus TaxID=7782 RepID=UPI001403B998|nr:STE20-related kinase adapter protein beta isoform X1 [Amblyraja radiata]XP_032880273.1 STE20-related kinase adapter protein beta isoform X1 [Amblyraja radiata]XP_032880274.1 STE20-related kinase adapter protein beta isoform X1 [Amblyraja radiata]XP_032880275.1 STE20-related kinase adapter protein beta isoform X1 [Amblyraja radiata]XP_032880276.1 STE20-related kinase adapter protein beta isoform X1 [Amblyraja radiata]XP_055494339.1 STE20-related kinase adapter protein beta [Leucoraja erinace